MPIQAQMHDGTILEFPDGTDEAVIDRAARNYVAGMTPKAPEPKKGFIQSAQETLSDSVEGIAQGATFNLADEAYGVFGAPIRVAVNAFTGQDEGKSLGQRFSDAYARSRDFARGRTKEARERSPIATTVGEIAGGSALAGTAARGGATLLNAAKPTYGSMIGRGAAEGALYGGAYGFGGGEGGVTERLRSAAGGGALGAATGGTVGAIGARMAQNAANKSIPTTEALKQQTTAAYDRARSVGLEVKPQAYDDFVNRLETSVSKLGIDPDVTPKAFGALKRIKSEAGAPKTLDDIDTLRRVARNAAGSIDPQERMIASEIIDDIDNFLAGLSPQDVIAGDALKATSALKEGQRLHAMRRKAELIEKAMDKAELSAAASGSGGNIDNAIRQRIKSILLNDKQRRAFSKDEIAVMEKVVRGGKMQNLLRLVGKLSPSGNGLSLLTHLYGGIASGGATLPVAAAGFGAKGMADAATPRAVDALSRMIRSGGQLPQVQMLPAQQRALLQSLLVGGSQQGAPSPQGGLLSMIP